MVTQTLYFIVQKKKWFLSPQRKIHSRTAPLGLSGFQSDSPLFPPKKASLTFKRSHYLTLSQPRPAAAFPLDVCSLFEICLNVSRTLSSSGAARAARKVMTAQFTFSPAVVMMTRPWPSIIHHRSLRLTLWWHSGTLLRLLGKLPIY